MERNCLIHESNSNVNYSESSAERALEYNLKEILANPAYSSGLDVSFILLKANIIDQAEYDTRLDLSSSLLSSSMIREDKSDKLILNSVFEQEYSIFYIIYFLIKSLPILDIFLNLLNFYISRFF